MVQDVQTTSPSSLCFQTCAFCCTMLCHGTHSKLGKDYLKALYCHPAYVIYMHSKSHKMHDWMKWMTQRPGIKVAGKNINNLRYADDTTLMAESEEKLKSLLMKVKEREKTGLKLNIQNKKIMASSPITSWEIDREKVETVTDFLFLSSKITADSDCSHEVKRC